MSLFLVLAACGEGSREEASESTSGSTTTIVPQPSTTEANVLTPRCGDPSQVEVRASIDSDREAVTIEVRSGQEVVFEGPVSPPWLEVFCLDADTDAGLWARFDDLDMSVSCILVREGRQVAKRTWTLNAVMVPEPESESDLPLPSDPMEVCAYQS